MPEITEIDRELIASTMQRARIPGVSIAHVDGRTNTLSTTTIGTTDKHATPAEGSVHPNTVFGAASLSKPVFAYLVLKLVEQGVLSRAGEPAVSGLDRPLQEILPLEKFFQGHGKELSKEDIELAKTITPRMLLSHTSGLGIDGSAKLSFKPGSEYAYSGMGLMYLQKVIEQVSGKSLETLAQENVFQPLGMSHSSFLPPERPGYMAHTISSLAKSKETPKTPNAANSVHTTTSDYAKLMTAWMNEKDCGLIRMSEAPTAKTQQKSATSRYILTDTGFYYYNKPKGTVQSIKLDKAQLDALREKFSNSIDILSNIQLKEITEITGHANLLQQAFIPQINLTKDLQKLPGESEPAAKDVPKEDKARLAWGLGLGLELDKTGKAVRAFHTGDMNQYRSQVALNLEDKSCIVYFANGRDHKEANGHILGPLIITPKIPVPHAHSWFYEKFRFAKNLDELIGGPNFGLRASKPEKTDSYSVIAAMMPKRTPTPAPKPSPIEDIPKDSTPSNPHKDDTQVREANAAAETPPDGSSFDPTPFSKVPKPEKE